MPLDQILNGLGEGVRLDDLAQVHARCISPTFREALRPLRSSIENSTLPTALLLTETAEAVALGFSRVAPLLLLHAEHMTQCTARPGSGDNLLTVVRKHAQSVSLSSEPHSLFQEFVAQNGAEQLVALVLKTAVLPRFNLLMRDITSLLALDEEMQHSMAMRNMSLACRELDVVYKHLNTKLKLRDMPDLQSDSPGLLSRRGSWALGLVRGWLGA